MTAELDALVEAWEVAVLTDGPDRASYHGDDFDASADADVARILKVVDPYTHLAVIDFGCGSGRLARHLQNHYRRLVAVDCSPLMMEAAFARCTAEQGRAGAEYHVDDGRLVAAHLAYGYVDAIVAWDVLGYLPLGYVADVLLPMFATILRPGGVLAFTLDIGEAGVVEDRPVDRRRWPPWAVETDFSAAGFAVLLDPAGLHLARRL